MEFNETSHNSGRRDNNGRRDNDERRYHPKKDFDPNKRHSVRRQVIRRLANDKRRYVGPLMPNIYFSLQVIIVLLILSMILQFNPGTGVTYISIVISIVSIGYFLIKRKDVLNRQFRN
ncbi:MAG: hypothetical protein KAR81_01870 [Sulfurimonas sp.]|nr:hypothetical protein [Sulfurimonas sp.]